MKKNHSIFIDGIDGDFCRVLAENDLAFEMPTFLLPEGTKEGEWLKVTFAQDLAKTASEKDKTQKLLDELQHKDSGLQI